MSKSWLDYLIIEYTFFETLFNTYIKYFEPYISDLYVNMLTILFG